MCSRALSLCSLSKTKLPCDCPKDEVCKVYNSIEYNTDTSALPSLIRGEDIVRTI